MKKAFTLIELLIVVAIIAILAAIAVPNFLEAQTRAKIARVLSDQRTYATALETYLIDNGAYIPHWPYAGPAPAYTLPDNINTALARAAGDTANEAKLRLIPSFGFRNDAAAPNRVISLTTPVAFLNAYVPDTFSTFKQATFGYVQGKSGFILFSPGADGVDQLGESKGAEVVMDSGQSQPSPFLVAGPGNGTTAPTPTTPAMGTEKGAFTYDATNGTASAGDVYRVK